MFFFVFAFERKREKKETFFVISTLICVIVKKNITKRTPLYMASIPVL